MQIKEYINSHFKGQRLPQDMLTMIDNLVTSNLRNELRRGDPTLMSLLAEKGLYDVDEENLIRDETNINLNDNKDGKLSEKINENSMKLSRDINEENVLLKTATTGGESLKSIIDDSTSLVNKSHDTLEEKKEVSQQLTSPDELILLVDSPLDQEKKDNIINDNLHNEEQKPAEKLRKRFSIKDAIKGSHHHHHFTHNSNHQHSHGADHQHGHGADHQHGHVTDHQHGHVTDHQHVLDKNIGSETSPLVTSSTVGGIDSSFSLAKENHVSDYKHDTDIKTVLKDDNLNSDVWNNDKVISSIHETFHQNSVIQTSVRFPNVKDNLDDQNVNNQNQNVNNPNVDNQNQKIENVESPVLTVESPVLTVESPVLTVESPVLTVESPVLTVLTDEVDNNPYENVKENSHQESNPHILTSYQEGNHRNLQNINDSKIVLDESSLHNVVVASNQMEPVNEKIDNKVIDITPGSNEQLKTLTSNDFSKVIDLSPKNKESDYLHAPDHQDFDKKKDQISQPSGEFFYSNKEEIDEKQNRELGNKELNDQANGNEVEKPSSGYFHDFIQFFTGTSFDGDKNKPVDELDSSSKKEEDAQDLNAQISTDMPVEVLLLKTSMVSSNTAASFSNDKSAEIHDSNVVLSDTKMIDIKSSEFLQTITPSNELEEAIPLTQSYTSIQSDPLNVQDHVMKDFGISISSDLLISLTKISTKPDSRFTEETSQVFVVYPKEIKETQPQNFQTTEIPPSLTDQNDSTKMNCEHSY